MLRLRPLSAFSLRHHVQQIRTAVQGRLIRLNNPTGETLLTRRPDRPLPEPERLTRVWQSLPVFVAIMAGSIFTIFNYQKANSSVVASTLYALRVNPLSREILGEEINFASSFPWIQGPIDPLHGKVDVKFKVRGNTGTAIVRFWCRRENRKVPFETVEWSLQLENGEIVNLLGAEALDPQIKAELPVAIEGVSRNE